MHCNEIPKLWSIPELELELLDVLFSSAPEDAWLAWRAKYELSGIRSFDKPGLLSRLHTVLAGNPEILGAEFEQVDDVCKMAAVQNKLLEEALHSLLSALSDRNIYPILLKGAALFSSVIKGMPLRPMHDCDLLVTPKELPIIWETLKSLGWDTCELTELPVLQTNCISVRSPSGSEFDIHWSLFMEWRAQDATDLIRDAAIVTRIDGRIAEVIQPDDWLFMALVQGTHPTFCRSYWILDVYGFLTSKREIRWERVLDLAWAFHMNFRLSQACRMLAERFGAPIPAEFLRELGKTKISFVEKVELNAIRGRLTSNNVTWEAGAAWVVTRYLQGGETSSLPGHILGFLRFLRYHYNERSLLRALARGFGHAFRRLLPKKTAAVAPGKEKSDATAIDARV